MDSGGNIYVVDSNNNAVKEMPPGCTSASCVTELGSGFNNPIGVAVDGSGNVFVADTGNSAVKEIPLATAPSLSFASTAVGSTSTDSPQTVTVQNSGNANLTLPVLSGLDNPSVAAGFSLASSTTCPQLTSSSSSAATLSAGASCTYTINFVPTAVGAISGSLVLTDNSLNAAAPGYTAQSIALGGTGTAAPTTTAAANASAGYSSSAQSVTLLATITSSLSVNEGTVTFTVLRGSTTVGTATSGTVSGGSASVNYTLPASTAAGTYTIQAVYNDASGNFSTSSDSTHSLTVNQVPPTISWAAPSAITYGTPLSTTQLNATATYGGSAVAGTFTYTPAAGTVLTAGSNQTLSVTFTPTDASDYATPAAATTTTITVSKAAASVTPVAASKTYGASDPTLNGTLTGFVASDNVKASYSRAAGETVAGGPYAISATLSPVGVLGNYSITYNTANFTINKATASATPVAASKTYGSSDPTLNGTLTGFVASDSVTASYSRAAGETVAGGPYTISATLSPARVLGNYTITYNTANFTINKATASVTPAAASKSYGASDPTLSGTLTGFVASDNVKASYSRAAGETVAGGPYTISATLSPSGVLGNYSITYNTAQFTINKATASVTANNATMTYGSSLPALSGTLTGVVSGDNITAIYATTATSASPTGSYPITATLNDPGSKLDNYSVSNTAGTLTITVSSNTTAVLSSSTNQPL